MSVRALLEKELGTTYRLERELGGGGMSHVFLAEEVALGRRVVVKVLPPEATASLDADRFRREIQLAASLQHPHVVPLHAAGSAGELLWYTMPYVEGESLRARLAREHELPIETAIDIWRELLDALSYAHGKGIIHRDIKPENVLLTGRHTVVTDFGVAKAITNATGHVATTATGVAVGTPAYMSPEQASGDPTVDHRADIYAAGLVMYEMLAGRAPFEGLPISQLMAAHATRAPESVGTHRPGVPERLAALVMSCLAKLPADRPQSADAVLASLSAATTPASGEQAVADGGAGGHGKRADRSRRRRVLVAGTVVAIGAAALFAYQGMRTPAAGGRVGSDPNDTTVRSVAILSFESSDSDRGIRAEAREAIRTEILRSSRLFTLTGTNEVNWYRWAFDVDNVSDVNRDSAFRALAKVGHHVVLRGRVSRLGAGYVITVDPQRTDARSPMIAPISVTAPDSTSLPTAVQELARAVRAALEDAAPRMVGPPRYLLVTTGSLEALRLFQEATLLAFGPRGDFGASIQLFREAVRVDPKFAEGWRRLAIQLTNSGIKRDERTRAAIRAYEVREGTKSRERILIEGTYFAALGQRDRALELWAPGVERGLQDVVHNTALNYGSRGEHRIAEAHFARNQPNYVRFGNGPMEHATSLLALGRIDDAERMIRWGDSVSPGNEFVKDARRRRHIALRDYAALRAMSEAVVLGDTIPLASSLRLSASRRRRTLSAIEGRLDESRRASEAAVAATLAFDSPADAARERIEQIRIEASAGLDPRVLTEGLRALLREQPFSGMPPLDRPHSSLVFAWVTLGAFDEAERALAAWDREMAEPFNLFDDRDRRLAHGDIALARGRVTDALRIFREQQARYCGSCLLPRIARAFEVQQLPDSAIAAYEGYLAATNPQQDATDAHELARTYRRLGELYEAKGDLRRAIQRYADFVRLWKDADAELQPQVAEIRDRVAALQRRIS